MKNGYLPEEITVLTGYVGQAKKLRKAFEANRFSVQMSERDLADMQQIEDLSRRGETVTNVPECTTNVPAAESVCTTNVPAAESVCTTNVPAAEPVCTITCVCVCVCVCMYVCVCMCACLWYVCNV